jgi:hypothetical protein
VCITRSIGAGQHGIIPGSANGLDKRLGAGAGGIEYYAGAVRHKIHARGLHSGRRPQSLFNMMLAGGAGHAQHRQGY